MSGLSPTAFQAVAGNMEWQPEIYLPGVAMEVGRAQHFLGAAPLSPHLYSPDSGGPLLLQKISKPPSTLLLLQALVGVTPPSERSGSYKMVAVHGAALGCILLLCKRTRIPYTCHPLRTCQTAEPSRAEHLDACRAVWRASNPPHLTPLTHPPTLPCQGASLCFPAAGLRRSSTTPGAGASPRVTVKSP